MYQHLPSPDGDVAARMPAVFACAQSSGCSPAQTLHRTQASARVVLHEPPEAEDLHEHGRSEHEKEREPEPRVVPLPVVIHGQQHVRAHVPKEHEHGQHDPQTVQPQALLRSSSSSPDPFPRQGAQARAPAAPVTRRRLTAMADVDGRAVQIVVVERRIVLLIQLREPGNDPHAIGFRCHLARRNVSSPPSSVSGLVTSLPKYLCSAASTHERENFINLQYCEFMNKSV